MLSPFCLFLDLDNTASILTRLNGFRRQEQSVYYLPIFIVDSGSPSLSSTNTLTIRVCDCDADGIAQTCNAEAYILPAGLSTGALIAILACVLTLLGMSVILIRSGHCTQPITCVYAVVFYLIQKASKSMIVTKPLSLISD
uniref:Cadherin domain-containing protein n=1 Tax=Naja naja TaxID=35670 RepID=A0A8C6XRZ2_NAJNA